jgi:hypothetical protein
MNRLEGDLVAQLSKLSDDLDDVVGAIDKQTYDEIRRQDFDPPLDQEFCVTLTTKQIIAIEAVNKDLSALAKHHEAGSLLVYPTSQMDDDLREILGMPNFACAPIAGGFRAAGFQIAHKAESEQAFVLDWLIGIYLKHGADWRKAAGERLEKVVAQAKERYAQKIAEQPIVRKA